MRKRRTVSTVLVLKRPKNRLLPVPRKRPTPAGLVSLHKDLWRVLLSYLGPKDTRSLMLSCKKALAMCVEFDRVAFFSAVSCGPRFSFLDVIFSPPLCFFKSTSAAHKRDKRLKLEEVLRLCPPSFAQTYCVDMGRHVFPHAASSHYSVTMYYTRPEFTRCKLCQLDSVADLYLCQVTKDVASHTAAGVNCQTAYYHLNYFAKQDSTVSLPKHYSVRANDKECHILMEGTRVGDRILTRFKALQEVHHFCEDYEKLDKRSLCLVCLCCDGCRDRIVLTYNCH